MNNFRSRISREGEPETGDLLKTKRSNRKPRAERAELESFSELVIAREQARIANHRLDDRHRLANQATVIARHRRARHKVQLVNLSGGGAMIEADFRPDLWDRVDLDLADGDRVGRLECAVRWIRASRIGLEFAHETRIEADGDTRAALLREVLARSFSDVVQATITEAESVAEALDIELRTAEQRDNPRHPLIWNGEVLFQHDSHPVRLRNISASGALVESRSGFPVGAEVYLDLDQGGALFAHVSWSHGDQFGLAFRQPFDLARLAAVKPQVAPSRWAQPDYLRDGSPDSSPWASEWGRLTLGELNRTLRR